MATLTTAGGAPECREAGSEADTRQHIRASSLFLAGNVFSLAITFVPHLVLVRYLSTDAYAHLAYALSLIGVAKTYALGFNEAMSRFVPIYHTKSERSKVLGTIVVVFGVTLFISTVLIGTFAVAHEPILSALTKGREPARLLLILMFLVPLESVDLLLMNLFACFNRTREVFWGRYIVPPTLRVFVTIALVVWRYPLEFLAQGYVLVELITVVGFGVIALRELHRRNLLGRGFRLCLPWREIFGFSLPLMASNVVGIIGSSIPVMLLGYFQPMSSVAYYRVVLPAAVLTSIIPGNFMPLYVPSASRLFAKGDIEGINHLFWETSTWMGVLAFPLFLTTFCFSRPLTTLLYGERYASSAPILSILSLAYFVNVIFAFNGVTLKVMGKVRQMVMLNLVTPLGIVLLNLLLIPRYGAIGAAVGTAGGMLLQNLLRQIGLRRSGEGVRFFEWRYGGIYSILAGSTLLLFLIDRMLPPNVYAALALATADWLLVLWLVKKQLRIANTFPELARLPVIGRVLA